MNRYLLADQFLQHALNVLVSFLLFSLLTESIMWLFNIRNPRLRAIFRLLPPLRLALEPLFWLLPSWAMLVNVNIFSCSHPLQHFLFGLLSDSTKQELSLFGLNTVTGSLLLKVPLFLLNSAIVSVVVFSLYKVMALIWQYAVSMIEIKGVRRRGTNNLRPIYNKKLLRELYKQNIQIVISPEIQIPLAGWGRCIILPKDFADELSQKEFESVLSHELEHHRWHDTIVRMLSQFVAAIYWWVPMTNWLHKLEHEQEIASDRSVHLYGMRSVDLASALKKTAQTQKTPHYKCAAFVRKARRPTLIARIKVALAPLSLKKQNKTCAALGMLFILGLFLILRFVIC